MTSFRVERVKKELRKVARVVYVSRNEASNQCVKNKNPRPMTLPSTPRQQVYSNIDLSVGWGEVFSTSVYEPTLVARAGVFTPGRTYTFSLTATDSDGSAGYAGKPVRAPLRCFSNYSDEPCQGNAAFLQLFRTLIRATN